jgi:hypothetical protein
MNNPVPLKVRPETVLGIHPDVLKAFGEAVDRILTNMDEVSASLDIISLYFERKGLKEELFTEDELKGDGSTGSPTPDSPTKESPSP